VQRALGNCRSVAECIHRHNCHESLHRLEIAFRRSSPRCTAEMHVSGMQETNYICQADFTRRLLAFALRAQELHDCILLGIAR